MFNKIVNKVIINKENTKLGDFKMKVAPSYIKKLCVDLKNSSGRDDMYNILDDTVSRVSDFIALDMTTFAGNGYKFQCMLKQNIKPVEMRQVAKEASASIIDIIPIKNSDVCVVVSKAGT